MIADGKVRVMDTKLLGQSGVRLPEIGFGTWHYNGDPNLIRRSIELGSFLIDTAESYGTEASVGKAVADCREQVFIATKVSPSHFRHDQVIEACDRSLSNLGIDAIDLYQLHAPSSRVPVEETMLAVSELVAHGKVRHVGVSNFSTAELKAAESALGADLIVENQIKYSLLDHEFADSVIPYCEERGIMVLAYSSLEQGSFQRQLKRNKQLADVMTGICTETGKTPAQVMLNWTLKSPVVITIPQTNTLSRVEENCGASGWRLSDEQWDALTRAAGSRRSSYWWR